MAYLDEGLNTFRTQWKAEHPNATVYWIADSNHSTNPRVTQHAPDDGKSGGPGDTIGEVDAVDVMPGNGVTAADLNTLFNTLYAERDSRIFYVIHGDKIFSSVTQPWVIREYTGDYHSHVHISVLDNYENNPTEWKLSDTPLKWNYVALSDVHLPEQLSLGMDDAAYGGYNHVHRAQLLLNYQEKKNPLSVDGIYGPKTRNKVSSVFGTNGKTISLTQLRDLHGI